MITRSLGPNASVEVDVEGPFPVEKGDRFLICSDGLTGLVEDVEIGTLVDCLPEDLAVRVLVDLANLRGGPDNTTVVIVRIRLPNIDDSLLPGMQGRGRIRAGDCSLATFVFRRPLRWIRSWFWF